jgi:hypothetical protein
MTTYDEYMKNTLQQIADSYTIFQNLKDKSGDLEIIKRELAKITGILQALANKLEVNKQEFSDYQHLLSPIRYFLQNHDFFREINIMSLLYSDDPMRLKNLRLVILDALDEKNLIEHIKAILKSDKVG